MLKFLLGGRRLVRDACCAADNYRDPPSPPNEKATPVEEWMDTSDNGEVPRARPFRVQWREKSLEVVREC